MLANGLNKLALQHLPAALKIDEAAIKRCFPEKTFAILVCVEHNGAVAASFCVTMEIASEPETEPKSRA